MLSAESVEVAGMSAELKRVEQEKEQMLHESRLMMDKVEALNKELVAAAKEKDAAFSELEVLRVQLEQVQQVLPHEAVPMKQEQRLPTLSPAAKALCEEMQAAQLMREGVERQSDHAARDLSEELLQAAQDKTELSAQLSTSKHLTFELGQRVALLTSQLLAAQQQQSQQPPPQKVGIVVLADEGRSANGVEAHSTSSAEMLLLRHQVT